MNYNAEGKTGNCQIHHLLSFAQKNQHRFTIGKDSVILSDLTTVKAVYRPARGQCQGFLESIFELMEIDLPMMPKQGARHVVVDSTGVKVYTHGCCRIGWEPVRGSVSSELPP